LRLKSRVENLLCCISLLCVEAFPKICDFVDQVKIPSSIISANKSKLVFHTLSQRNSGRPDTRYDFYEDSAGILPASLRITVSGIRFGIRRALFSRKLLFQNYLRLVPVVGLEPTQEN
jgi:hypothetical protein